jgi:N-acyl-D-amino-acid deacylase
MKITLLLLPLCAVFLGHARADVPNDVESATRRGLARVKQAASDWQDNKTCFSCHHQTLPMVAALEGERVGFPLDKEWLKSQADNTHRFFTRSIKTMDAGEHLAGGAGTTAFGFWALSLDQRPVDQTTTSMVTYMLKIQGVARSSDRKPNAPPKLEDGLWRASCRRAPMQASLIGNTVLVLMGLEKYATPEQRPQVEKARAAAEKWLATAPMKEQQDRLWHLWGLHHLGGNDVMKMSTLAAIFAAQRVDGGWAEIDDGQSDTYSTGQTLFMLLKTGTAADHPSIPRARDYLLKSQYADGSWLATSHVKFKTQPYFENDDPHGVSQFLSTAATAWATAGLAQLLPAK